MRRQQKPYQENQATRAVSKQEINIKKTRMVQLNELNQTYDDYMRSNACDQVTHSRGLTSHWLKLWRRIL